MLRIFPGLIIISLLYCLIVLKPSTIIDFCGKMLVTASTLGFWFNSYSFNWYVSAIVLFYVLAPAINKLTKKYDFLIVLSLEVLAIVIAIICYKFGLSYLIGTVIRIPVFGVGILFGRYCLNNEKTKCTNKLSILLIIILWFVSGGVALLLEFGWLNNYKIVCAGLNCMPLVIFAPTSVLLCVIFADTVDLKRNRLLDGLLACVGKYTYELYLLHICVLLCMDKMNVSNMEKVIVCMVICLLCCRPLYVIEHKIMKKVLGKYE